MTIEHLAIAAGNVHPPHNFLYANATARNAASITDAALLNCLALQSDTGTYYRLTGVSPATWQAVGGAGGGGDFSSDTATSVDSELVLFSGTAGKTGKRATMTGTPYVASGVLSLNKITLTQPATGATMTIVDGKTLTISNTMTLSGTDGAALAIGLGGTLGTAAYTASSAYATAVQGTTADAALPAASFTNAAVTGKILTGFVSGAGVVAAADSILTAIQKINGNIAASGSGTVTSVAATVPAFLSVSGSPISTSGTIAIGFSGTALPVANGGTGTTTSTGTGNVVLSTGPTMTTPALGAATATSINKVAFTTPATGSTITIVDAKTFTVSNSVTLAGTDASTLNIGTGGTLAGMAYQSAGAVAITGGTITGMPTPTVGGDVATKTYVDSVAAGLTIKAACRLCSNTALTATYSNGASGVGATLTNSTTQAALSIDSVATVVGDRVLVTGQATTFQNGIYTVTNVGSGATNWVLTRATDFDNNPNGEIVEGAFVIVAEGTLYSKTGWVETGVAASWVVGTTAIVFSQLASGAGGGTVTSVGISGGTTGLTSTAAVTTSGNLTLSGILVGANGGTGVDNGARTITVAGNVTHAGAFAQTFTATATTTLTLPTTGTLATLAGTETFTAKTLTTPTINGGSAGQMASVGIKAAATAFDISLSSVEALTATRSLILKVFDANRNLQMAGDLVTAGAFTTAGAFGLTLTQTALTNVTLPTTGTLATLAGAETFTNKTLTNPTLTNFTESGVAASSAAYTIDLNNGTDFEITTTGAITITLPAAVAGKSYSLTIIYGGTHAVTFAGGTLIKYAGGTAPTATMVAGKYDVYAIKCNRAGTATLVLDGGRSF